MSCRRIGFGALLCALLAACTERTPPPDYRSAYVLAAHEGDTTLRVHIDCTPGQRVRVEGSNMECGPDGVEMDVAPPADGGPIGVGGSVVSTQLRAPLPAWMRPISVSLRSDANDGPEVNRQHIQVLEGRTARGGASADVSLGLSQSFLVDVVGRAGSTIRSGANLVGDIPASGRVTLRVSLLNVLADLDSECVRWERDLTIDGDRTFSMSTSVCPREGLSQALRERRIISPPAEIVGIEPDIALFQGSAVLHWSSRLADLEYVADVQEVPSARPCRYSGPAPDRHVEVRELRTGEVVAHRVFPAATCHRATDGSILLALQRELRTRPVAREGRTTVVPEVVISPADAPRVRAVPPVATWVEGDGLRARVTERGVTALEVLWGTEWEPVMSAEPGGGWTAPWISVRRDDEILAMQPCADEPTALCGEHVERLRTASVTEGLRWALDGTNASLEVGDVGVAPGWAYQDGSFRSQHVSILCTVVASSIACARRVQTRPSWAIASLAVAAVAPIIPPDLVLLFLGLVLGLACGFVPFAEPSLGRAARQLRMSRLLYVTETAIFSVLAWLAFAIAFRATSQLPAVVQGSWWWISTPDGWVGHSALGIALSMLAIAVGHVLQREHRLTAGSAVVTTIGQASLRCQRSPSATRVHGSSRRPQPRWGSARPRSRSGGRRAPSWCAINLARRAASARSSRASRPPAAVSICSPSRPMRTNNCRRIPRSTRARTRSSDAPPRSPRSTRRPTPPRAQRRCASSRRSIRER
jgi:hypothetical protein